MNKETSEIQELIQKRYSIYKSYQESWCDKKLKYTTPEPKEIDGLAEDIVKSIKKNFSDLPVDFIIESLTHLGYAPNVVYDDNGHFAVSGGIFSPIPTTESGIFDDDISIDTFVEPSQWFDNIREALSDYLKSI